MKEEFDSIRKKTIEQLKAGKPLLCKDDAFAPLLTSILNAALEGEKMHILQKKKDKTNLYAIMYVFLIWNPKASG